MASFKQSMIYVFRIRSLNFELGGFSFLTAAGGKNPVKNGVLHPDTYGIC